MQLSCFKSLGLRASAATAGVMSFASSAFAQSGVFGSIPTYGGSTDARSGITNVLQGVLQFLALIAVVVIVIAGIRMVVSSGDEGAVDTAKKTILWAVIGLIVILLAGAIVDFVATEVVGEVQGTS